MADDTGTAGHGTLSRTAQAIAALVGGAGERGIPREKLAPLLYMADVIAREYLGHPITDIEWTAADLPSSTKLRRENALESDPYATRGVTFADVVDVLYNLDNRMALAVVVNRRIFDDVRAAHRMLDGLHMPSGLLTERIGHMILAASNRFTTTIDPEAVLRSAHSMASRDVRVGPNMDDPIRREPLADADSVKVPEPDDVFAVLNNLTGEEAFKLFDHAGVLPDDADVVKGWNLMDETDVGTMIHDCLAIALHTERLAVVYKAAREAVARKVAK